MLGLAATMSAPAVVVPAPALDVTPPAGSGLQTIVLAGGCFWGSQVVYEHVNGVTQALSGYGAVQTLRMIFGLAYRLKSLGNRHA